MKSRSLTALVVTALLTAGGAWAQGPAALVAKVSAKSLTCADFDKDSPVAHESRALRMAPEGAKRVSDHDLAVNTKAGVHRFIDKKPYREELGGFHWSYCGYLPALRAHLIGMEDEDLFTGKLLLDGDGRVLDGGQTVYPSPSGKLFLAASQEDGDELERWVISDMSGRRLWAGPSGVIKTENKIEIAALEFEAPLWISDDAIRVTATCGDSLGTKGPMTLTHEGKVWRWKTGLRCKD